MLNDPPPLNIKLETAEEKAQRYWRNNALIRELENNTVDRSESEPSTTIITNHIEQLRNFKHDIREIILTRPTQILNQYLLSIQAKKNKLLREKLRRLERNNVSEL